ncbi:MAG: copper resistance system multicopper oxidase [Vicinamibacterales bacterium]
MSRPARVSFAPLTRRAGGAPATRELRGRRFDLSIGETTVNLTGRRRTAQTINGSLPGPLLRWREGDEVTLRVANALDEPTSLHWHGLILPANMDGVPGLSFSGIAPGEAYDYRFTVKQSGTYWYHSHSGFQEQLGVAGPIVIEPREPDPTPCDREHVVMLADWTDEDPARVLRKLKQQSDYYNWRQRTLGTFLADVRRQGVRETLAERRMWGEMRMSAADLADVTGATYTYLVNGQPPAANWTGLFAPGERVRLRIINGSGMTYFDVRIPGLAMTVVAADGQPVRPVTVDELRIAVAETYDVIVEPAGREAYTLFAQAMDRTGFAAATLAVRAGLRAPVPDLDPRPVLTMTDMGHGAGHAGHATASPPATDPHAGHVMPPPAADPHAGHVAPPAPAADEHAGHGTAAGTSVLRHPATEAGNPLVDMQTEAPASNLDDPGIGLRGNGRRVLTYADLRSTFEDPDGREPSRTLELHLTGHMERFAWSFNGVKFSQAEPIRLAYGERLRIVLVNDTMMTHPIHLHGLWSDLEDDAGNFLVRKHTIDMPPGARRTYRVTADALGRWAFHCHLLFHMDTGMMREVHVTERRTS